jgi:hypothetical protein
LEQQREQMIAEAAYYRAEKRGFAPGRELDDWIAAEAEIAELTSAVLHPLTRAARDLSQGRGEEAPPIVRSQQTLAASRTVR